MPRHSTWFMPNIRITWNDRMFKYPIADYMHSYGRVLLNRIYDTAAPSKLASAGQWPIITGRSRSGFRLLERENPPGIDLLNIAQSPVSREFYAPRVEERRQAVQQRRQLDETYIHRRVRDNLNRRSRRRERGKQQVINARG